MMPQNAPAPENNPAAFVRVVDQALGDFVRYKKTYNHALDIGIRPLDIVNYSMGGMNDAQRATFHQVLAQSPWAISRVAALVKACRAGFDGPIMRVTAPILYPETRKEVWTDEDVEGCKLLDTV